MKLIHISETFNRKSIQKHGLLPSEVKLPHHLSFFKEEGLCTEDGKALYTWQSCDKDSKFIKDMVFCKAYIHPRNDMAYSTDFSKLVDKFLGPHNHMTYDVYEIDVPDQETDLYHVQEPSGSIYNSCYDMPIEFAHNDKWLHIYKTALKNLRIVGKAEFEYTKGQYRIRNK